MLAFPGYEEKLEKQRARGKMTARERIEELEAMMARQAEPSGSTLDDQVALLEKSYELAAKYMPAGQGGTSQQPSAADTKEDKKTVRNGKAVAQPVGRWPNASYPPLHNT
mgnify:CR=1 FL=1